MSETFMPDFQVNCAKMAKRIQLVFQTQLGLNTPN